MFKTKATRESKAVEARFRTQAEKAYERYKIAKEIEETDRLKKIVAESERREEHFSDAKAMYIIETGKDERYDGDESRRSLQIFGGVKESFGKGVKMLFRNMYTDTKFELKWQEFMCITFYLQVPVSYMIRHISMVRHWGALLVLIVYVIIGTCIAMPVYMLLMFMGNYGRKSYVRFWECVPILKGVAYSVIIMTLIQEISNVMFTTIFVDYLVDTLPAKTTPWAGCDFPHKSRRCVANPVKGGYNASCCALEEKNCSYQQWAENIICYAATDYFKFPRKSRRQVNDLVPYSRRAGLQMTLIIIALWLLILLILLIGLKKVRLIMTLLNLILLLLVFLPLILATLYTSNYSMFDGLDSDFGDLLDYKFWLEVSTYSLHRELAGDVITFSALSSPGISTTVDTLCIYTIKFMFLAFLTVWTSISLGMLQDYFNVDDWKCVHVDGFAVMYGIFPQIISQTGMGKPLLLLYFTVITYWCFSVTVYTLNSFIGAIFEEFPKLIKFKIIVCTFLCVGCCVANLFMLQVDIEKLYETWYMKDYVEMKLILVFFTLLGIYLYTLKRLSDDYHFTYGQKLNLFWIHGVKVAMLLTASIITLRIFLQSQQFTLKQALVPMSMIIPIIVGAIISFLKYKTGKRATIISPDPQWGPPTVAERRARRRFDPKRDLRYRSAIQKCKHACLLGTMGLSREIKYWRNKRLTQCRIKVE